MCLVRTVSGTIRRVLSGFSSFLFSTEAGVTARIDRTSIQRQKQRQKGLDQKVMEVECFKKWEYENASSLRMLFHMSMFGDRKSEEGLEIIACCLIFIQSRK